MPDINPEEFVDDVTPVELVDARPPEFSDEALALTFARLHRDKLRYVAEWSRWFIWDGACWRRDTRLVAFDRARAVCRAASAEAKEPRIKNALTSAKTIAAVERIARTDYRLAADTDQWNTDPDIVQPPKGNDAKTVNLATGERYDARPEDYCTKMAAVAPGGDCPLWRAFLERITGGDVDLQNYLQRVAGYCLTGHTYEHALFFLHGPGGNGKGTLTGTLLGAMGDYAMTAPMDVFTESRFDRHPTELARLDGARLVIATETEAGRRWNESRIKALTGGDNISARFMRGDFFEFTPQFKLMIAGNHKPGLRNVDEAIRRRLHLIPFTVTIPKDERDEHLREKLKEEWSGILQWTIDGCAEWRRIGLAPPAAVIAATDDYLAGEDGLALWIAERCTTEPDDADLTADLFESWKAWAERAREYVGSMKAFAQNLEGRGFGKKRDGHTRRMMFTGIRVVRQDTSEEYWNR